MIFLLLALALSASAATAPAPAAPAPHPRPYWLKMYSLAPYREMWTGELEVKKLEAALPKVVAAIEKNGGRLTLPLTRFAGTQMEQQLSLATPLKNAKPLLKALRKLGKMEEPATRPSITPAARAEIREKLSRLLKEKSENASLWKDSPAASEAADEIVAHLTDIESIALSPDGEILWNITVKEAR